ncbi:MAG: serine/threonine protein kinase [Verrucomicrobiales bacterium]|nr:serine/threonine protein kinase [Verrucomicrobiales bacterium]
MDTFGERERVKRLFLEAQEIPPGEERNAFLERACGADAGLRAELEELLCGQVAGDAFFAADPLGQLKVAPAAALPAGPAGGLIEGPGAVLDRYRLLERIGEGGFGVVYAAEQQAPVVRKVALKILKPGMDTRQVVARFEAERQALALMDHPHIARVFDGGTTPSGRPYFVMELVAGVPITEYCVAQRLELRERLELFQAVCAALQHAHQKGIIHRDIKPSNVLVVRDGERPAPKVIDFGVAKALGDPLVGGTVITQLHQFVGTPAYTSPEQAAAGGLDVDTRSDIYGLGVLLYELLTGEAPFDTRSLLHAGFDEMRRIIREEYPPTPSARLASRTSGAGQLGRGGRASRSRLARELDWIVMKAMEKDRNRRYATANALAEDVGRFLANEPVTAGAPGAFYQFRKFARRHRTALMAATAAAMSLGIGTVVSLHQAVVANGARQRATEARERAVTLAAEAAAQRERAEALAGEAEEKARESQAVLRFLQEHVLAAPRPPVTGEGGLGVDVTLAEAITAAAPALGASFRDLPLAEASIRHTLGLTYRSLGLPHEALPHFEEAFALRHQHAGPEHPQTLNSLQYLAEACHDAGNVEEAITLRKQLVELRRELLGPEAPATIEAMYGLAWEYFNTNPSDALALHQEILEICQRAFGAEHGRTLDAMSNVANSYEAIGRNDLASALRREVYAIRWRMLGPDHPETILASLQAAVAAESEGRDGEALALREEALDGCRRIYGESHSTTLSAVHDLARSYLHCGRIREAVRTMESLADTYRGFYGPDHPKVSDVMIVLGQYYEASGRPEEAREMLRRSYLLRRERLGPEHPGTLRVVRLLGGEPPAADQATEADAVGDGSGKK